MSVEKHLETLYEKLAALESRVCKLEKGPAELAQEVRHVQQRYSPATVEVPAEPAVEALQDEVWVPEPEPVVEEAPKPKKATKGKVKP